MGAKLTPMTDVDLDTWGAKFSSRLSIAPADYGATAAQATAIGVAHEAYHDALLKAVTPVTRTPMAVEEKNRLRAIFTQEARLLMSVIEGFPQLTDTQRIDLGMTVRKTSTPAGIPGKAKIDSVGVDGHKWTVRAHGSDSSVKRGKDVKGATFMCYVGENPPGDTSLWSFVENTHKMECTIEFDAALLPGTKVWASAFFRNSVDASGEAADPISTVINFGANLVSKPVSMRKAA